MTTVSKPENRQVQKAEKAPHRRWAIPRDWLLTLFILAVLVTLLSLLVWIGGGTAELIDTPRPSM